MLIGAEPFDPTSFFTQLGVAGVVAAVLVWVIIDLRKQRDDDRKAASESQAKYEALVQTVLPLVSEFPRLVRLNTDAVEKNSKVLSDVAQASGRNLSEAEATRVRDLLTDLVTTRRRGEA